MTSNPTWRDTTAHFPIRRVQEPRTATGTLACMMDTRNRAKHTGSPCGKTLDAERHLVDHLSSLHQTTRCRWAKDRPNGRGSQTLDACELPRSSALQWRSAQKQTTRAIRWFQSSRVVFRRPHGLAIDQSNLDHTCSKA